MQNNHNTFPLLDISLTDRISMLMKENAIIAQALRKTDVRYQEEFTRVIEKAS